MLAHLQCTILKSFGCTIKNGNRLRIVQDFRELNAHSHSDKFSIQHVCVYVFMHYTVLGSIHASDTIEKIVLNLNYQSEELETARYMAELLQERDNFTP